MSDEVFEWELVLSEERAADALRLLSEAREENKRLRGLLEQPVILSGWQDLVADRDGRKAQLAEAWAEIRTLREENAQLCGYANWAEQEEALADQGGEG